MNEIAFIGLLSFFVAMCSSILGFGAGLMATGVCIALADDPKTGVAWAGAVVFASSLNKVIVYWKSIDWRTCFERSLWVTPGGLVGLYLLGIFPKEWFDGAAGGLLVVLGAEEAWRLFTRPNVDHRPSKSTWWTNFLSLISGILSGFSHASGAILMHISRAATIGRAEAIATTAAISIILNLEKQIGYLLMDFLPPSGIKGYIVIFACGGLGVLIGEQIMRRAFDERSFDWISVMTIVALGLFLLLRTIFQ